MTEVIIVVQNGIKLEEAIQLGMDCAKSSYCSYAIIRFNETKLVVSKADNLESVMAQYQYKRKHFPTI